MYPNYATVFFPFQVCSWGGYTFIINLIPMHVLLCIVTGRYSSRLYIAYAPLVSAFSYALAQKIEVYQLNMSLVPFVWQIILLG